MGRRETSDGHNHRETPNYAISIARRALPPGGQVTLVGFAWPRAGRAARSHASSSPPQRHGRWRVHEDKRRIAYLRRTGRRSGGYEHDRPAERNPGRAGVAGYPAGQGYSRHRRHRRAGSHVSRAPGSGTRIGPLSSHGSPVARARVRTAGRTSALGRDGPRRHRELTWGNGQRWLTGSRQIQFCR